MSKLNINNEKFGEQLAILAAFGVQSSNTSVDNDITVAFANAYNEALEKGVSEDDAVAAVFGLAEVVTDATETSWDDTALGLIKSASSAFGVTDKVKNWLSSLLK